MAPSPQDFGIGIAVATAALAVASSTSQVLRVALPRLGYLCFLICFYEHSTTGDKFFARHLWEAMAISAAVVMFLSDHFPLFGLTCMAVIGDFMRLYPTTAYKSQTGITIAVAVALLAWRYLAREDGPEPGEQAAPFAGDFGGMAPEQVEPAPRPRRRRTIPSPATRRPARAPRSAKPSADDASPGALPGTSPGVMPGVMRGPMTGSLPGPMFGEVPGPVASRGRNSLLRRVSRRGRSGRPSANTPETEQSPWHWPRN
ncbi:hypothetical protein GCM10009839_02810 [Catenulispora yoronensis]|uniref:Integral membrane protein n=1 Tax=Catenulispora yoronensis TaxID=450799 RepID=A0ABP5F2D4_9ACTN